MKKTWALALLSEDFDDEGDEIILNTSNQAAIVGGIAHPYWRAPLEVEKSWSE